MIELEFWYEFGSTYSYLSVSRIEGLARAAEISVSWRAFLLGPIFKEQGWSDSPFNVYPAKGRYMWKDMERLCAGYGIPFARPSRFPRDGLLAARVACLARAEAERWLPEFVRAVFRANFVEDREIGDALEIRSILDSLDLPGEELIGRAQTPENKQRLRDETEQAIEIGIFGAPSFVARGELFWGRPSRRRSGVAASAELESIRGRPVKASMDWKVGTCRKRHRSSSSGCGTRSRRCTSGRPLPSGEPSRKETSPSSAA